MFRLDDDGEYILLLQMSAFRTMFSFSLRFVNGGHRTAIQMVDIGVPLYE